MGEFDVTFKRFLARLSRLALELFTEGRFGQGVEFQPLDREVTVALRSVDQAFLLSKGRERWVEHFEAEVGLSKTDRAAILRRAQLLEVQYDLPVWTTIVLMSKHRGPADPPRVFGGARGTLVRKLTPRYVRLWAVPAEPLLREDVEALPWVGATRATAELREEAFRRIMSVRNPELRDELHREMTTLARLQYDEEEVSRIHERLSMVTSREILESTTLGQALIELGEERGESRGKEIGKAIGQKLGEKLGEKRVAIENIDLLVQSRTPGHGAPAWLRRIDDISRLQQIFRELLSASDAKSVRAVLARYRPSKG